MVLPLQQGNLKPFDKREVHVEAVPREGDAISYMMLFCALLVVKNSKSTMDQVVTVVPLGGKVRFLAQELCGLMHEGMNPQP